MAWNRMQKKCAIGETEYNEILSLYLRKTENLLEEKEGMGERKKREDWEKEQREEKRDKRELS